MLHLEFEFLAVLDQKLQFSVENVQSQSDLVYFLMILVKDGTFLVEIVRFLVQNGAFQK